MSDFLIHLGLICLWVVYWQAVVIADIQAHGKWWEPFVIPIIVGTYSVLKFSFFGICGVMIIFTLYKMTEAIQSIFQLAVS